LEEKEVAELVDSLAPESEVPVDAADRPVEREVGEARFLGHLAARRLGGRLPRLQVALGEAPVAVRVADQQVAHDAVRAAAEHHAAGARLAGGPGASRLHDSNAERGTWNAGHSRWGRSRRRRRGLSLMFRVPRFGVGTDSLSTLHGK